MARTTRYATALTALGVVGLLSGCATPGPRSAETRAQSGKAGNSKAGLATRAIIALEKGDFANAINFAEQAVENSPSNAQFRTLLGNAYFAGGRFASAEAAYRDSLALQDGQAPVILKLALVSIGQGKNDQAVGLLQSAQGLLDPADLGLALALAGRPHDAAALLDNAARQIGADSRVRQNLALAHALSGDWTTARTVAEQDLAPDQVEARLQQWMSFAKPARASDQLAALTGIAPVAADPGQPVRLALSREGTRMASNDAVPTASNEAPAPQAMPVIEQPVAVSAEPAPVVEEVQAPEVVVPVAPIAAAVPTFISPTPVVEAAAPAPALSEIQPKPRVVAARVKPVRALLAQARSGGPVVQLGAFANRGNVESAWARFTARHPSLRNYAPTTARFDAGNSTVYRLSVAGFASSREAQSYCSGLKRAGGNCFVRSSGGDQPVRIALR